MEKKNLEKTVDRIAQEIFKHTELIKDLVTKEEFKRLDQRTEKLEKTTERLEKTTKRLEKTTERLDQTTRQIASIVTDHADKIANLVTKEEFRQMRDEFFKGQDKILAMLTHLERERIFAFDRIERLEGEVDKIKKHLAIV